MSIHQPTPLPTLPPRSTLISNPARSSTPTPDTNSEHTDQDCIIIDTEPLSITEDGIKRKLSMPYISRRQSTGKATLRKRPSMSPSFSSFLTPTKLRLARRLSAQSPLATAISPASNPTPATSPVSDPASPNTAKSKLPAIEAITNWLAVKPSIPGQIERPATEPSAAPEPVPAMLRYPPRDPNEIPHSPDCIDCAHRIAVKEGHAIPVGGDEWMDDTLDVEIGKGGRSFRQQEDKVDTAFGSYHSLSSATDVGESPTRPDLSISTPISARRALQLASRDNSGLDLAALLENEEEVMFSSPDMSPIDEPSELPASMSLSRSMSAGPEGIHTAAQRVWLCSPPPRSSISPLALDSTTTLNVSAAPIAMTRSKSEATVTSLSVTPKHPSTLNGRNGRSMRRRPFVTRSISTGRLATELDDQGRVVCLSAHSDRVLANKISAEPCWRRPIASVPPTPTSPSQTSAPFGSVARQRGSVNGSGRMGLPTPRRANSVQVEGLAEFGVVKGRRQSLDDDRPRYEDRRRSVPANGFGSFRVKGWLGTGPSATA